MKQEYLNIDEIMRNTRRYWYIDGLVEIMGGISMICLTFSYTLISTINNSLIRNLAFALGQPLIILMGAFLVNKIVNFLKQRLTFPRTGYLSYKKPQDAKQLSRKWKALVVGALSGVMFSVLFKLIPERFLPMICAFFIALFPAYLGYFLGVRRFFIIAGITMLLGASITYWAPPAQTAFSLLLGGIGGVWFLSGLFAFLVYMHHTTPKQGDSV